jgi:DNA-binding MarR family transcriptional regulator
MWHERPAQHRLVNSNLDSDVAPVSFLLKRAAQYSADLFAEQLGKTGLTQRQFTLMETVLANEGASQTELVKTTGIDRSTLADLVNRLETQGYVRRERSSTDARVNYVFLTDHGRDTVLKVKPVAMLVDEALVRESACRASRFIRRGTCSNCPASSTKQPEPLPGNSNSVTAVLPVLSRAAIHPAAPWASGGR